MFDKTLRRAAINSVAVKGAPPPASTCCFISASICETLISLGPTLATSSSAGAPPLHDRATTEEKTSPATASNRVTSVKPDLRREIRLTAASHFVLKLAFTFIVVTLGGAIIYVNAMLCMRQGPAIWK